MPHGVSPHYRQISILPLMSSPIPSNFFPHEVHQLVSDLHAQKQLIRQNWRETKQESTVAAADVYDGDWLGDGIVPNVFVEGWMLDGITINGEVRILLIGSLQGLELLLVVSRVVPLPVDIRVVRWKGKRGCIQRVYMGSHPIIFLLWQQSRSVLHFYSCRLNRLILRVGRLVFTPHELLYHKLNAIYFAEPKRQQGIFPIRWNRLIHSFFTLQMYLIIQMQADLSQGHRPWKKQHRGNLSLAEIKNPLRHYIEKEIKEINLFAYPNRPELPVNLSIGDPTLSLQFRTHPKNLNIIASQVGKIDGYTNMQGLQSAREAIAAKFPVKNYRVTKDDVWMTSGGSLAIWASMQLLAEEGDNFLFPTPGFPLSFTIAKSMGVEPRLYVLKENDGWKADLKQMESLIDEKTRFIYVNDPSNPLGSCWPESHKQQILQLCQRRNLPIVVDQIYEGITFGEPARTFAGCSAGDVTIFKCSGLTKRWLGPGWRLGWLIVHGSEEAKLFYNKRLRGIFNILLMPHTVMQCAVAEIISSEINEEHLSSRMNLLKINSNLLKEGLAGEDYCEFLSATGALYATVLLRLDKLGIHSDIQFCKQFYAEENVIVFPGSFFMSNTPFIRLVITDNVLKIENFLFRFKKFCGRLVSIGK